MKTFTKFLASLVLAVVMLPAVASAQLVVSQGGTGLTSVTANNILYGVSSSLRLGSEAAFQYNPSTNRLTVDYASTTGFSATNGDLSKLTVSYASSTGFTATNATLGTATGTNFYGFGLSDCDTAGSSGLTWDVTTGKFGCNTITGTGDGVSNWFLKGTGYIAPTSTVGISVAASSTIGGGTNTTGLTIYGGATTTGSVKFSNITSALTLTDSTGLLSGYAGSACTNQFVRSLSATGAATCATVANTDLANSTVSYGGVSLSLGGSDATPAFNLIDATGLPISTGVAGLGTSVATALGVNVGTAGSFVVNGGALGTPSSGTLTNATGLPISTGVSGLGSNVATLLATFSSANLATALTDETGTAGSAVFSASPTFTGTAAFANYTATNGTTTYASSTSHFSVSSYATNSYINSLLQIPNGTGPTLNATGTIAYDETDKQLLVGTSTSLTPGVIRIVDSIYKFKVPSTSPMFATGTITYLPTEMDGYTVTNIFCSVEGGTSKAITIYGESITCSTSGQADDGAISINTIAAASTTVPFTAGNTSGVVNWLNVSIKGTYTRE